MLTGAEEREQVVALVGVGVALLGHDLKRFFPGVLGDGLNAHERAAGTPPGRGVE